MRCKKVIVAGKEYGASLQETVATGTAFLGGVLLWLWQHLNMDTAEKAVALVGLLVMLLRCVYLVIQIRDKTKAINITDYDRAKARAELDHVHEVRRTQEIDGQRVENNLHVENRRIRLLDTKTIMAVLERAKRKK